MPQKPYLWDMKYPTILFVLLWAGACFGQDFPTSGKDTLWYDAQGTLILSPNGANSFTLLEFAKDSFRHVRTFDHPSGQIRADEIQELNPRKGGLTRWHPNGKLHVQANYLFSETDSMALPQLRYVNCWDADGHQLMEDGEGTYMEWHSNGKLSILFTSKGGEIQGPVQAWDTAGNPTPFTAEMQQELTQLPIPWMTFLTEPRPLNMLDVRKLVGYPTKARNAGIQGEVTLKVLVDEQGNYAKHVIAKSDHPLLAQACEAQVVRLKFTPATQNGRPIPYWVTIPFLFTIQGRKK